MKHHSLIGDSISDYCLPFTPAEAFQKIVSCSAFQKVYPHILTICTTKYYSLMVCEDKCTPKYDWYILCLVHLLETCLTILFHGSCMIKGYKQNRVWKKQESIKASMQENTESLYISPSAERGAHSSYVVLKV